jgi:Tol biopolymer transport system component
MRRITSAPDSNHPSWSRDGRFIYFESNRASLSDIWRAPVAGGPEERVSQGGGSRPYESADGRTLFFKRRLSESSLWAMPVGGGPEQQVVECLPAGDTFAVGLAGVYHTACGGDLRAAPLYLLDPATGHNRLVGNLEGFGGGLAISPEGRTILYTKLVGEGGDLMMIENFR